MDFSLDVIIPYKKNFRRIPDLIIELEKISNLNKIIIVQDYCDDNSISFRSHDKVIIAQNILKPGALGARLTGIEMSKSSHVMFFDSDDYYIGGPEIEIDVNFDLFISNYIVNGKFIHTEPFMSIREFAHNLSLMPFSGLIVKNNFARKFIDTLNINLNSCQDDFFVGTLLFSGAKTVHLNNCLSSLVSSSDSISLNFNKYQGFDELIDLFKLHISTKSKYKKISYHLLKIRVSMSKLNPSLGVLFGKLFFNKVSI